MPKSKGPLSGLTKEQIRKKLAEDFEGVPVQKLPAGVAPKTRNGVDEGKFKSMKDLYGESHGGLEVHTANLHAINN